MLRLPILFLCALYILTVPIIGADLNKKHKTISTTFDVSKHPEARVMGLEILVRNEKHLLSKDKSVRVDFGLKKKKKDIGSFYITNRNFGGKKILNTNLQTSPDANDRQEFRLLYGMETLHATLRYVDGDTQISRIFIIIHDANDKKRPFKKIRSARLK
ncbi:hypothetical protein [Kordiimonas sp. SCSIO 12610]|uniref:hypothetical protein n=1 Tax=Kordiimonas sp. SCSIO 12610 TaxID=2829597 RepID=UPI00210A7F46|nr:hypothetical protein [Kordiimonas sp. SCSIO 12610]UTW54966.1 hypothetical protein KFF44_14330 [Kordiimonas sp. SCSIO 12610]